MTKVLVANRGEIAVRVLRACQDLGISTVAVYSDADRNSLHVRHADEAYNIGPAPVRESYLRIDRIIEAARRAKADAIHPGYGLLSENAEFSQACRDEGIVFVGPSPAVIKAMGNKLIARLTMQSAGVPVVPGIYDHIRNEDHAETTADEIGYPVVIKASAGGGGKGMRVVRSASEIGVALREASAEASAAFGDDTLYIEKLLQSVRHVEIQVLADGLGNILHLGERECSIQRRHQKIIEESPSPAISSEMRQSMGEIAVRAARAVGYESAGTIEFLVDENKNFYFLEMNTRLQVEHAVTEMVTGIDIVMEQLRIASGCKLRYRQEDISIKGWAIECRITAEDPFNGFTPSVGKIVGLHEPSGPGVRVDSGIFPGFESSLHYDPLLSKLIVWGENRTQAILRMRRALREYKVIGLQTIIPLHLRVTETATFLDGQIDTSFIDQMDVLARSSHRSRTCLAAVAAALVVHTNRNNISPKISLGKSNGPSPWKLAARREGLRPR